MCPDSREILAVLAVTLVACGKASPPPGVINDLCSIQRQNRTTIGYLDGQELQYLVFGSPTVMRRSAISSSDMANATSIWEAKTTNVSVPGGTEGQLSPDGNWIVYKDERKRLVLSNVSRTDKRTLFDSESVLTPLYWSPDSRYLMYVTKSDRLDTACSLCGRWP
jgi:hypothetical protein